MIETRLTALRARLGNALESIGAVQDVSSVFDELRTRYEEPHRHYHTLAHMEACLGWLDWFHASAEHAGEVELALWFHDAVYDPSASDNEGRSAELAATRLGNLGADRESIHRITTHIEATACHLAPRGDAALVIDLDLTILGAAPAAYQRFEEAIRREYAAVAEDTFCAARRWILEGFLAREDIYAVRGIRDELEQAARANLTRRVRELSLGTTCGVSAKAGT